MELILYLSMAAGVCYMTYFFIFFLENLKSLEIKSQEREIRAVLILSMAL